MTRVVFDTTVLVSAFFAPHGTPAALLRRVRSEDIEVVLSSAILEELSRVLRTSRRRRSHPYSDDAIRRYLRNLSKLALFINPPPLAGVVRDPADDVILATARGVQPALLVTGDQDLLVIGRYQDVEIVTPRTLLDRLA